jgi:CheY-like chemotaxis protein
VRVLVVDDNRDLLDSLALVLQGAGYEVETATSAARALAAHRERAADVVITDIFMPETDGLETVAAFRAGWPGLKIIAMSGGGRMAKGNYLNAAGFAGADAVLQKPFDLARLLSALEGLDRPS